MCPRTLLAPEETRQLNETLGDRLRAVRTARGLVQAEVALCLGVTAEFYARIERGNALPGVGTLYKLAVILDISADCLLGQEELPDLGPNSCPEPGSLEQRARKCARLLRAASPRTLRVVTWLLDQIDRSASGTP